MSADDELLAIGRLVKEAAQSKKNVVLLRTNVEALSRCLSDASGKLNRVLQGVTYQDLDATLSGIPTADDVKSALTEYQTEVKRSVELNARVAELGI